MSDRRQSLLAAAEAARWDIGEDTHEAVTASLYDAASRIAGRAVQRKDEPPAFDLDRVIGRVVTNRWLGFPLMMLMLAVVFWVKIEGANVHSGMIA
jgi:ferrous iron transport protein B